MVVGFQQRIKFLMFLSQKVGQGISMGFKMAKEEVIKDINPMMGDVSPPISSQLSRMHFGRNTATLHLQNYRKRLLKRIEIATGKVTKFLTATPTPPSNRPT